MKPPSVNWFINHYKVRIKKEMQKFPDLVKSIPKSLIYDFILFTARQRLIYKEDLKTEVEDYLKNKYRRNLAWIKTKIKEDFYNKIVERDGEYCQFCNSINDLTLDHIIPKSKGGEDLLENLQLLCRSCNTKKKDIL